MHRGGSRSYPLLARDSRLPNDIASFGAGGLDDAIRASGKEGASVSAEGEGGAGSFVAMRAP